MAVIMVQHVQVAKIHMEEDDQGRLKPVHELETLAMQLVSAVRQRLMVAVEGLPAAGGPAGITCGSGSRRSDLASDGAHLARARFGAPMRAHWQPAAGLVGSHG